MRTALSAVIAMALVACTYNQQAAVPPAEYADSAAAPRSLAHQSATTDAGMAQGTAADASAAEQDASDDAATQHEVDAEAATDAGQDAGPKPLWPVGIYDVTYTRDLQIGNGGCLPDNLDPEVWDLRADALYIGKVRWEGSKSYPAYVVFETPGNPQTMTVEFSEPMMGWTMRSGSTLSPPATACLAKILISGTKR